jgi:hypothetical protein
VKEYRRRRFGLSQKNELDSFAKKFVEFHRAMRITSRVTTKFWRMSAHDERSDGSRKRFYFISVFAEDRDDDDGDDDDDDTVSNTHPHSVCRPRGETIDRPRSPRDVKSRKKFHQVFILFRDERGLLRFRGDFWKTPLQHESTYLRRKCPTRKILSFFLRGSVSPFPAYLLQVAAVRVLGSLVTISPPHHLNTWAYP